MRKFLFVCCFSALFSLGAQAGELAGIAALDAFRAPMEEILREARKGGEADLAVVGRFCAEAAEAWKPMLGEPFDLDRYGVPSERQPEVWRQVRMLALLIHYLDEAVRRGNHALVQRAADMLPRTYADLRKALEGY
jgi:hypothetical protein